MSEAITFDTRRFVKNLAARSFTGAEAEEQFQPDPHRASHAAHRLVYIEITEKIHGG